MWKYSDVPVYFSKLMDTFNALGFYRAKVNFEPNSWAPSKTAQNTFMQSFVLIDFNSLLNFTRIELSVDNEPVNCAPSNINQREMK